MSINGIGTTGYPTAAYGTKRTQQNTVEKSFAGSTTRSSYNGAYSLRIGGMVSRALSDGGNVTVYEADGYTSENPMVKVVTTSADGQEHEQFIDPRTIDISNATENEMLALNAYLVKEGKLDNNVYSSSVLSGSNLSNANVTSVMNLKKNFFSNVKEMMEMQYNAHNYAGYVQYKKMWDIYTLFMDRK